MLDKLYENLDTKIQNLAKCIFIIEAIGSVISGIILLINTSIWIGLLILVLGPVVALVFTWPLYALGKLVEDVHALRSNPKINDIDKSLKLLTEPIKREAEEKARREAEEKAAKREAEEKTKREAKEKAKHEAEVKKEKTLPEQLAYALRFQTDEGMINCLKDVKDDTVQSILKSPAPLVRTQIEKLLEQLQ